MVARTTLPSSSEHMNKLKFCFQFQGWLSSPEARAITLSQIDKVIEFATCNCPDWHDTAAPNLSASSGCALSMSTLNLYHLNDWVILPATELKNCSFVELLAHEPQVAKWFVTHWWGSPVTDFARCVEQHVLTRGLKRHTPYWVCAFACRQHALEREITPDPVGTSFVKALRVTEGILLVLNHRGQGTSPQGPHNPFSRVWCCLELCMAKCLMRGRHGARQMLLDISTVHEGHPQLLTDGITREDLRHAKAAMHYKVQRERAFPVDVIRDGLTLKVQDACATKEQDRWRILNFLAKREDLEAEPYREHDEYENANRILRAIFAVAVWPQALQTRRVEEFRLPGLLAGDLRRDCIEIDFSACAPAVRDADLGALAGGLPGSGALRALALHFVSCDGLTLEGMRALSAGLPGTLADLSLSFASCPGVDDRGAAELASALPPALASLHLDFENCSVGTEGVRTLVEELPPGLQSLSLKFALCAGVGDHGLSVFTEGGAGFPQTLARLELCFRACLHINDASVVALGAQLPSALRILSLNYDICSKITDRGIATLAASLPISVQKLALHLTVCKGVGDAGIASIAFELLRLKNLESLDLSFGEPSDWGSDGNKISDAGVAALAQALPDLHTLRLSFEGCDQVTHVSVAALKAALVHPPHELLLNFKGTGFAIRAGAKHSVIRRFESGQIPLDWVPLEKTSVKPAEPYVVQDGRCFEKVLQHFTQEEMLMLFRAKIMESGRRMGKVKIGIARPATRGERVPTIVQGKVTSTVSVKDTTSMVVRAATVFGEEYVLSWEKFLENWLVPGVELHGTDPDTEEYRQLGFKAFTPRPDKSIWVYETTARDVALLPTGHFVSGWGALQPLQAGDFLAMPAPEERAVEIYLMPRSSLDMYADLASQDDMLFHFRSKIMARGTRMGKVKSGWARPAIRGERIVTRVNGRVTSNVTVTDTSSMVVRAPTADKEEYVLTEDRFGANWELPGAEPEGASAEAEELRASGFKSYRPRRNKSIWVYQITAEDRQLVPTGGFISAWGALQPLQAGDYLAMPAPEERATEVYLMPSTSLEQYAALASQQDMLREFAPRIMRSGKLLKKIKIGMARPAKRGETIVTRVGGRVTSTVTVQDDYSMVVRAPTVDQEEYALSREKFEANWVVPGTDLVGSSHDVNTLRGRGFRCYRPRPDKCVWVYKVTAEDFGSIPTGGFMTSFGVLQTFETGDFLAMPAPEERATEVYLMPPDAIGQYERMDAPGPEGTTDLCKWVAGFGTAEPAECTNPWVPTTPMPEDTDAGDICFCGSRLVANAAFCHSCGKPRKCLKPQPWHPVSPTSAVANKNCTAKPVKGSQFCTIA